MVVAVVCMVISLLVIGIMFTLSAFHDDRVRRAHESRLAVLEKDIARFKEWINFEDEGTIVMGDAIRVKPMDKAI